MLTRVALTLTLSSTLGLVAACSANDLGTDDFSGLDPKADGFGERINLQGTINNGELMGIVVGETPKYGAFRFIATPGDIVTVKVAAQAPSADDALTGGTPMVWIMDGEFEPIEQAIAGLGAAEITIDVPPAPTSTYYIVVRDQARADRLFTVTYDATASYMRCDQEDENPCKSVPSGCCGLSWLPISDQAGFDASVDCTNAECADAPVEGTGPKAFCNEFSFCELAEEGGGA